MKRFFTIALTTLAVAAGATSLASTAAMANSKVYNVLSCRTTSGSASVTSKATLSNSSFTTAAVIYCPIVRDRTDAAPTSVQVGFINLSTLVVGDGKFKCRVIATSPKGSASSFGNEIQSGATAATGAIINLPLPASQIVDGSYSVRCQIPRRGAGDPISSIASIKVIEADPDN